jgi:dihydrolipoamide dehydrogenase
MVPKVMPTKLLVIGSGAIGVEFASFYSDMGAEVTIVEMLDRILPSRMPTSPPSFTRR